MTPKYRIHNAPTPFALEQAARLKSTHAIVYSVGPCSALTFKKDPISGRTMDEFPLYFDDYPEVASLRHAEDAGWLEPLRGHIRAMCDRAVTLGIKPVIHTYEPMLPLAFEQEYPDLVKVYKRKTQDGTIDVHTLMDPDNPETWKLFKSKYREMARDLPKAAMFVITTGDTASAYWCVPEAKMPVAERLVKMVEAAREGVREVRKDIQIVFRLWWRNFPDEFYRDGHRLIGEVTGIRNPGEVMCKIGMPHNDPKIVMSTLFRKLPADVPVMYKSSRMDIHNNTPLTKAIGTYPANRQQIMEISYERFNEKPWPWCKVAHIRKDLKAVKEFNLSGYVSLPINMQNNERHLNPEVGNLGRMNTWLFERLSQGDKRSDSKLVAAWLEKEFGAPQPKVVVDALLAADVLADEGIQWGRGINHRVSFGSLHQTKLYWMYDGFIQPDFPYRIANPDAALIEELIQLKHSAYERAMGHVYQLEVAEAAIDPRLYREIHDGYVVFADFISLRRDWASYLLMQYALEKGVYPPERKVLGRMSRYVESFIKNLVRLKETPAGKKAMGELSFPDHFPLT